MTPFELTLLIAALFFCCLSIVLFFLLKFSESEIRRFEGYANNRLEIIVEQDRKRSLLMKRIRLLEKEAAMRGQP